jgi:hypothetical protein
VIPFTSFVLKLLESKPAAVRGEDAKEPVRFDGESTR